MAAGAPAMAAVPGQAPGSAVSLATRGSHSLPGGAAATSSGQVSTQMVHQRVYGSRSRVRLQSSVFLEGVTAEGSPPVHSAHRNLHGLITLESKGDREESAYSLPMALMF